MEAKVIKMKNEHLRGGLGGMVRTERVTGWACIPKVGED